MIQSFQQGAAALARSSVYAATKFSQKSAGAVGHQRLSNQNLLPSARAQFLAPAHLGYTASMFSPSRHSLLASRLQPPSSLSVIEGLQRLLIIRVLRSLSRHRCSAF